MASGTIQKTVVETGYLTNQSADSDDHGGSVQKYGRIGVLSLSYRKRSGYTAETWTTLCTSSIKPANSQSVATSWGSIKATVMFETSGDVKLYAHDSAFTGFARLAIPFITAN